VRSPVAWLAFAVLMLPIDAVAEHRLAIEPSIQVIEVHDDNLNFSAEAPLEDRIRRITPGLELRWESPRWSARGTYGFDSETFATQSRLDNTRARERAAVSIQYLAAPRLMFSMDAGYTDTNTLADLNVDTGLAAARVRGRQINVGPSLRLRISPRLTVAASGSSTNTDVKNGIGMRAQVETLTVERRISPRDLFSVNYEHNHRVFIGAEATQPISTNAFFAGWTRDFGAHSQLMLHAGSRITNGSPAADFSGAVTHNWRFSSIAFSVLRSQTTVIGYAGAVDTQSVQTRFTYIPNRRFTAYAAPAVIRSTHQELEGTVYRVGLGARYAVTPMVGFDIAYNHDTQNGAIDPLQANADFSHATLSIGFTTQWKRMR